jgi:hypothetical protein
MKPEFSRKIFNTEILNFIKIGTLEAKVFHAGERMDGQA